jgi:hypothetical protein
VEVDPNFNVVVAVAAVVEIIVKEKPVDTKPVMYLFLKRSRMNKIIK